VLSLPAQVRIFAATSPVDFRKAHDGPVTIVRDGFEHDPFDGSLFVFFNKRRDRMKAIVWDGSGYWVLYKRLEHGRYQVFDRVSEKDGAYELPSTDLALLLDGIDLRGAKRRLSHDGIASIVSS